MTLLHRLYSDEGQSPWIDNLSRGSVRSGGLANMVDEGIRGVTSNPTIFQKAMTGSDVYDADFARLIEGGSVLKAQIIAVAAGWGLAVVGTFVILKVLDAVMGLRVSQASEIEGLDLSQQNEEGYIFI